MAALGQGSTVGGWADEKVAIEERGDGRKDGRREVGAGVGRQKTGDKNETAQGRHEGRRKKASGLEGVME